MMESLNLSEAQTAAIRAIHEDSMEDIITIRRKTREARREIHDLLAQAELDTALIRKRVNALHEMEARLEGRVVENLIREAAVLNPDQRARYQKMMMGRWRHGGRGRK